MMTLSADGKLRLAVKLACLAGAGAAGTVHAQETTTTTTTTTTETSDSSVKFEPVQVTGSRIKQPSLTSTSSITAISSDEVRYQGTVNVESLINNMPQAFAEFATGDSNGATGTATVSLRGLGSQRTLVLIDGKRLMPGDPKQTPPAPDLNFIPAALIDRIDILSGGASAVYGSDAVAGVVNFIMKRDFEGLRVDGEGTVTNHGDGWQRQGTVVWGSNFARKAGNVTLFGNFQRVSAVTQDRRDFSACSFSTPTSGDVHTCAGSRVIPEGRILSYDRYYNNYYAGLHGGDEGYLPYYTIVDPSGQRTFVDDDNRTFNFAPYNYLQRNDDRWRLGGFGHYGINEHADVYGSAMFMDDRTVAQIAPSGIFGQRVSVPCDSELLSPQQRDFLCNFTAADPENHPAPGSTGSADVAILKRTTEVGPRQDDLRHTDFRLVLGVQGDIIGPWHYDVSAQHGHVIFSEVYLNDLSVARAQEALNGCAPVDDGGPVDTLLNVAGCHTLDIFQAGQVTPEAAAYVAGVGISKGDVIEEVLSGAITANLGEYGAKLPTASQGIGIAIGAEYRTERLDYLPDFEFQTGDLAGQGGPTPPVSGRFGVREFFTELNVPLIEGMVGAETLRIDAAYRWSDYTIAGIARSYKGGLEYAPVKDVMLRASYQRATRAPSVQELFAPQAVGLFVGSDPCAGVNLALPDAATEEECARSGVSHDQYVNQTIQDCNSGQCNALFGGSTDLKSEESTTRSFGLVFTPTFLKGFSATIDYFDISVNDAINVFPQSTLILCVFGGDEEQCDRIHRGPTGRLSGGNPAIFVEALNQNTATLNTTGVDFEANYRVNARDWGMGDNGRFSFNFIGTYVNELEFGLPGASYDCASLYGLNCGNPAPNWRHKFRTTWVTPVGLAVSLNWRFIGSVTLDKNERDNPLLRIGAFNSIDNELEAKNYLDLSATYMLPIPNQRIQLRAGANNITNTDPQPVSSNNPNPISGPPFGNGNTYPNVYDSMGTVFFLGLTADF